MPSSSAASKLSRVCQVRKPPRMEVSEVTGSRCWGWSLVFSSCRVGELFAPLAASTWPKRGQIVVVVSNFPLAKGTHLRTVGFMVTNQICACYWKALAFRQSRAVKQ